jgi:hypothetical protein
LPELLGSLHKEGSMKMTKPNIITAGIDTSKAKLDIAIHGEGSVFTVSNDEAGYASSFEREDALPVSMHINHRPTLFVSLNQRLVELPKTRLAIIRPFSRCVGVMDN